ncbi:B12-binding domain-containing radical SAM protein [Ideonella azotifigens]|uniref:B12-binding domain-containing radical SAM protein n=1 Tax=Ideonella azotifigens TaxID=513160 RepID=UPI001B865937|nr:radical SAM protein [Ideonella azotifigens]MCD2342091.1 B12-binding domain-containing radical SAM protein [Ideonella azotifigens]
MTAQMPALDVAQQAVLRALAYRQVFDCPLSADEVWQFLDAPGVSLREVKTALQRLQTAGLVAGRDDLFWIAEMEDPIERWIAKRDRADAQMPQALQVGHGLMRLPFVDGVAISGSLSKRSQAEDGDFDFLIITRRRRLWLVYVMLRLYRDNLPNPHMLCSNYVLASHKLALEQRDAFTAMELATLLPVAGRDQLMQMRQLNAWVDGYLPNRPPLSEFSEPVPDRMRGLCEAALAGPFGSWLDWCAWKLIHTRHRRTIPHLRSLTARRSLQLDRDVAKLHNSEWKYRILERYQSNLDRLEGLTGATISRGAAEDTVLVASAYHYRLDPKQWQAGKPYPPLGTLYAAGLVRSLGFQTQVFDAGLAESELAFLRQLERQRPAFVVLQEDGFNYLTKMCLDRMRDAALQMVRLARAFGARILVCSSDATDFPEPYLRAGATAVVRGESEATLAEVLQAWRDEQPWTEIPGLVHLVEDRLVRSAQRAPITDLDQLPPPAWDLVDLAPYREVWQRRHGHFSLNIATTRGCPYACNWCAKPLHGKRYTVRSPEQVVDELALLVQQHGAQHFWVTDDLFGLKPGWVQRFAALVQARGLKLRYTIQTRADLLLRDADDLQAMASSGLETAWIGAESGSQRILDAMDKGITRAQIDGAVQALKQHGVKPALFLQFGYLGETAEDIRLTHRMVDELQPDQIGISVSYPLPGTVFHERVKAQMGKKTHWLHSNDLDLMFPGNFSPAFYRHLHAYTSRRFQVMRCWSVLCGRLPASRRGGRLRELASLLRAMPALLRARLGLWREQRQSATAPMVAT